MSKTLVIVGTRKGCFILDHITVTEVVEGRFGFRPFRI